MPAQDEPGTAVLRALVARATLAPSTHNSQPWRWTVHADHVELELDEQVAGRLAADDPDHREVVMSCGAALLTLRVGAAQALLDARVDVLPDPHRPQLLACVTVVPAAVDAEFAGLDDVVPLRRTAWSAFDDTPLTAGLDERLAAEALAEGALLTEVGTDARAAVADLLEHADREGLDVGDRATTHDVTLLRQAPYLGVLATAGDAPADWLAAGQALQRVLLVAAAHGFSGGFLNAPCQVAADRDRLAALLPEAASPQVLLRLGHPRARPAPTPRRPVGDVVTVDGPIGPSGPESGSLALRGAGGDFTEDALG